MPIIVYIATSLDMKIARLNGDVDWLDKVNQENEDYGYYKFYSDLEMVAMGRKTFEAGFKLAGDKNPYEDKETVIFTKSGYQTDIQNINIHSDPFEFLKKHRKNRIWIVGGGVLIKDLIGAKLVDEIIISLIPIILGSGIPMFIDMDNETDLILQSSKSYDTGLVQLHYSVKK